MAWFEYHNAGNSEAQQLQAMSFVFAQDSVGKATTGVLTGLGVSQTTTASGSVVVAAGAGVVQAATLDGASLVGDVQSTTLDVLVASPMGSVARNDIVVADRATGSMRVIVGSPNVTPTDPTVPTSAIKLARIRNAANATTVPSSAIDDLRTFTGLGPAGPDSGWVNLPIVVGGWTAPSGARWQVRRTGKTVRFRGTLANSAFSGGWTTICTLPAGIPTPPERVALITSGNTAVSRSLFIDVDGSVQAYASATSAAWFVIGGSYMVD